MSTGAAPVLESRSLEKDYAPVISLLRPGLRVLDVGCGAGTISRDIAARLGEQGAVIGIDSSEHLIKRGKTLYGSQKNLTLQWVDLFRYEPDEPVDLIVSARVLQWLPNPLAALKRMKTWLKPGGQLSILDYDHTALEWQPQPPASMLAFYQSFLQWRADVGMNNQIARDLPDYLAKAGFIDVEAQDASETYRKGATNFLSKAGIWTKVAESRGQQMVKENYLNEQERLKAIKEYEKWITSTATSMIMKLVEVRGLKPA